MSDYDWLVLEHIILCMIITGLFLEHKFLCVIMNGLVLEHKILCVIMTDIFLEHKFLCIIPMCDYDWYVKRIKSYVWLWLTCFRAYIPMCNYGCKNIAGKSG